MIEYAQPLHAQDIAKLKGHDITIRNAVGGEKLTTLLGTEAILDEDTFVLTSGGEITVIGGVVGGKKTGVSKETTDIILDAGNYDPRVVRKVSRRLKIMNETVSRCDKPLDPRTIDLALDRATSLILELAGGTYYANDDYYPNPPVPQTITLRMSRLKLLSGMDISLATAKKILKSLEYVVVEEGNDSLTLEVPYFRTDVEVEDDLISDILRINNYANIPLQALSTPVPRDLTEDIYRFEERLRDLMVAQGAHEHITSSLTQGNGNKDQVILVNALTSDQNALRTDLVPGLTHVLSTYKKHKLSGIPVFEIGKVFRVSENNYLEGRLLTVMAGADSLATLLLSLGITNYHINQKHEIIIDDSLVGSLSPNTYTLVTDALIPHTKNYSGIISDFGHNSSLDLSLLCPSKVVYADIIDTLSLLKGDWTDISCKEVTKLKDQINNYLITITWDSSSKSIETDKSKILMTLKEKLDIDSNS
jgi:phenylalanyl-tRNA synthetase beta subunit